MTYALITLALVCGYLAFQLHQRDRRIASLTDSQSEERRAHDALVKHQWDTHLNDVQVWANRVQAPEVAVAQSIDPGDLTRQFTMYDNDEDLVAAFGELE